MKIIILVLIFLSFKLSYSQIDEILKKLPGVDDFFEQSAVTTTIKDAYRPAYWLSELNKNLPVQNGEKFTPDIRPGYYRFNFKTFCLHAGTYGPTEGAGYLIAPLKGLKAGLIKNILSRYNSHPEIDQKDVQFLIWGIEAGQKFSDYPGGFQIRVQSLLTAEEIAATEINVKEFTMDILPQETKNVLNLYSNIKGKLSDVNTKYEDVEKLAVKLGDSPMGPGSKNIDAGTWTALNGAYMRCFPHDYTNTDVELYIPSDVKTKIDKNGRVITLTDDESRIEILYDASGNSIVSATINGSELIVNSSINDKKIEIDSFAVLVKKSFKKKLKDNDIKVIISLKQIELSLVPVLLSNGQTTGAKLLTDAIGSYISKLDSKLPKDGGNISGLRDIYGLVFTPGNTFRQRLGTSGDGDTSNNRSSFVLHGPPRSLLPDVSAQFEPWVELRNSNCQVIRIEYLLFDISSEPGICLNESWPGADNNTLDFDITNDLNSSLQITERTSNSILAIDNDGSTINNTIKITCKDFGGWAKFSANVTYRKPDGTIVTQYAKESFTNLDYVNMPIDYNGNHIADWWEEHNSLYRNPSDDDETSPNNGNNGDGMTVYEEYRGFNILEEDGVSRHHRMDPSKKELFIVDPDHMMSYASLEWERATGIIPYILDISGIHGVGTEDAIEYRRVNFNSGFSPGVKYALIIHKIDGLEDPYGVYPYNGRQSIRAYCENPPFGYGPPKNTIRLIVFPDRIRENLDYALSRMDSVINRSRDGITYLGRVYSRNILQSFLTRMRNPRFYEQYINYITTIIIIHEMGHACSLPHHGNDDPALFFSGDLDCVMVSVSVEDIRNFGQMLRELGENLIRQIETLPPDENIIFTFSNLKFCLGPDNCKSMLNVNDRTP